MIDFKAFVAGLTRIGIAVRQPADSATMAVYHDALSDQTTAEEFEAFSRWSVRACDWSWFPKLRELTDALRKFRGAPPLEAEAAEAYERVLASGVYTPQGGTSWSFRGVLESCGRAAAEAFLVAGGPSAFVTSWKETERREKFTHAYAEAVREEPEDKLLPAGAPMRALPPAPMPSDREAGEILREIRQRSGVLVEAPRQRRKVDVVDLDTPQAQARMEELRRQAEAITAEVEAS